MTKFLMLFAIVSVLVVVLLPVALVIKTALSLKDGEDLAKAHDEELHEYTQK